MKKPTKKSLLVGFGLGFAIVTVNALGLLAPFKPRSAEVEEL